MNETRIMLAEDHVMVREGLKLLINSQPDMQVIDEVSDGSAACDHANKLQPDVIVMDISMPKMNGLEATRKLKQVCPQVNVLILTRHADNSFLHQLLRTGASGYVLKQSASRELIRAIRAIASGFNYLDPAITGDVMSGYLSRQLKRKSGTQDDISDREAEVIRLISWGYSNKEIAARLEISVKTVEAHKASAMRKLGFRGRVDIVRYAVLRGWLTDI
jgi:DNA-binding NarL/FixJ family response regulator